MAPLFFALGAGALSLLCAPPETPWDALRHLSKHQVYTVLNRDGSCATGNFVSVSDSSFVIETGGQRTLPKQAIVRISAGETPDVHTTVYSARSSWADVQSLQSPPYYSYLLLITNDGRQFVGSLIGVSPDQIIVTVDGSELRFAKEFLARVFLTGKKPAYEGTTIHWNPIDLSKKVISRSQPVPLYEKTVQEDNSAVACAPASVRAATP